MQKQSELEKEITQLRIELGKLYQQYEQTFRKKYIKGAVPIPQVALDNAKIFSTRENSLRMYPKNAKIAEIGTWSGYWAAQIMKNTNPEELHIFDKDFSRFDNQLFEKDELERITFHKGDSYEMMMKQADKYYDLIYIDGDHSLEGVSRDILGSSTKIRQNGLLVFNDYTSFIALTVVNCGVFEAVNDMLCNKIGLVEFIALEARNNNDIGVKIEKTSLLVEYANKFCIKYMK